MTEIFLLIIIATFVFVLLKFKTLKTLKPNEIEELSSSKEELIDAGLQIFKAGKNLFILLLVLFANFIFDLIAINNYRDMKGIFLLVSIVFCFICIGLLMNVATSLMNAGIRISRYVEKKEL